MCTITYIYNCWCICVWGQQCNLFDPCYKLWPFTIIAVDGCHQISLLPIYISINVCLQYCKCHTTWRPNCIQYGIIYHCIIFNSWINYCISNSGVNWWIICLRYFILSMRVVQPKKLGWSNVIVNLRVITYLINCNWTSGEYIEYID